MYVPPWTILAGLGALDRRELCNLLSSFESTTFLAISVDKLADLAGRFQNGGRDTEITAFAKRLNEAADNLFSSKATDRALRIRLLARMTDAFDLKQALPLSQRTANAQCAAMAFKASEIMAEPVADDTKGARRTPFQKVGAVVKSVRGRPKLDFSALVAERAQLVAKSVALAAKSGELTEDQQAAVAQRVREHIESLPPELRDDAMKSALKAGDTAAMIIFLSGTSAFTVVVGVNLAGFSAYILAAQASAFIPFMSGPAVVSTLFMLANPAFSVPVLLGAGVLLNRKVNNGQAAKLASIVAVQLGLRGLSADRDGLATSLDDFRNATVADFDGLSFDIRYETMARIAALTRSHGGLVPRASGSYDDKKGGGRFGTLLEGVISRRQGDALEVASVAGLTAGDMIYSAVSIDPMVLQAADFSRKDVIEDIFQFGAFADRVGSMSAAAAAGAGNNLRGYVSEQLVAARLVESGHVVSFPDTSNNPGFDLLVDGVPFQVKCLLGLDGLREHFLKYPDMPVYANGELAEAVLDSGADWADKVFYVDGFDREIADLVMRTSLEAGEALGDMNVPYFAIAVSSARNLHRVWKGKMPLADLPFSVLVDGSIKGGLSAVGGLTGKAFGLMVFGPAGALVLGGVGGVGALMGSGWARDRATHILSAEWLRQLDDATDTFSKALVSAIDAKIALLRSKRSQVEPASDPLRRWLVGRFDDDIASLAEARHELEFDLKALKQPSKARACLEVMTKASVHPMVVERELSDFLGVLRAEPSKTDAIGKKAGVAWSEMKRIVPSRAKG